MSLDRCDLDGKIDFSILSLPRHSCAQGHELLGPMIVN